MLRPHPLLQFLHSLHTLFRKFLRVNFVGMFWLVNFAPILGQKGPRKFLRESTRAYIIPLYDCIRQRCRPIRPKKWKRNQIRLPSPKRSRHRIRIYTSPLSQFGRYGGRRNPRPSFLYTEIVPEVGKFSLMNVNCFVRQGNSELFRCFALLTERSRDTN